MGTVSPLGVYTSQTSRIEPHTPWYQVLCPSPCLGAVSYTLLGGKLAPELLYFVLKQELLIVSVMASVSLLRFSSECRQQDQCTISLKLLEAKLPVAPKLVYFVLRKELLKH